MISPVKLPVTTDPDAHMMVRVRDGETELFGELYQRHRKHVIALIRHLSIARSLDVEDLAQQVFIRAYQARDGYVPSARFSTWLSTITRNVVLNAGREAGRRRSGSLQSSLENRFPRELISKCIVNHDPLQQMMNAESKCEVRDAIQTLGRRQQQVIRLVCFDGFTYREAAEKMGLTEIAVKSLLCRAKQNLREALEPGRFRSVDANSDHKSDIFKDSPAQR